MGPNQELDVIYNRYGEPVLRLLADGRFVGFDGSNFGFLDGKNLYDYKGQHRGWFEGGVMRDHSSAVVGFGENATDTPRPFLPFKQFKPFPGFVQFAPFRPYKQFAPFQPFKQYAWSYLDPRGLFYS
jgi:hypothetical protein